MGILKRNTNKKVDEVAEVSEVVKDKAKKKSSAAKIKTVSPLKRVLLGAHVSEKAASVEALGRYTFRVALDATKLDIKQAVKSHYGVLPVDVRVMNMEGKRKSFGKSKGKRSDWKKAIVTLPKGKSIDIHSGI